MKIRFDKKLKKLYRFKIIEKACWTMYMIEN